jgi:hypothetical protein
MFTHAVMRLITIAKAANIMADKEGIKAGADYSQYRNI